MAVATEAPSERKMFYGWWVLWVTMALSFVASIMSQLFTGTMLPSIEADTGWSRSSITLAVTMGGMAGGFLSPFFGQLADRYGPRVLSSIGLLVLIGSAVAVGMSREYSIAVFYVAYVVGRATSQNTMSGVIARTTAVNWFRRMRGRAVGMTAMAVPLGGAALIPVAQLMMNAGLDWWEVYYVFAATMLVTLTIPTVLILRRRPEDIGLLPDGDLAPADEGESGRAAALLDDELNWTLKEALHTRSLWFLIGAMTVGVCANGAIGFHQFAYFKDQGIAATAAATALSTYALSGALANGLWGLLVEKLSERVLGALTVTVAAVLCIFLLTVDTIVEAMAFAVLFGLMARGEGSIIVMMEAQYYGRKSFGAISGFSAPFQQVALGLGPTIAAVLYETTGKSYSAAFTLFGVMYAVSAVLIWFARKPVLRPVTSNQ